MQKPRSLPALHALSRKRQEAHRKRDTLKARRLSAHLTQSELANHLGVDPSTLSRWESGQRIPRTDALVRINTALDALSRRKQR